MKQPRICKFGYLTVSLWKDGQSNGKLIHCLVAEAFLGPKAFGMQVNHIDGDKINNCIRNLEYLSPLENSRHAVLYGLMPKGERAGAAKLTEVQVREIRAAEGSLSHAGIAQRYGITATAVWRILRRQTWKHVL
jgi:hypothetical protein